MSEFSYQPPNADSFLHTLRRYLEAIKKDEIANLLINANCTISPSSQYSNLRWNAYYTTIIFSVPVERIPKFTENVLKELCAASNKIFPLDVGYDIMECDVSALLEDPTDDEQGPINLPPLIRDRLIEHDGLRFRSRSEIKIYDALKKRNVLFFANATAILGNKNLKREPDFLICQNGKWGILEVMGDKAHPSTTAMRDHDRARLFKDYGLYSIEFYDAERCYNTPEEVVSDFLQRL